MLTAKDRHQIALKAVGNKFPMHSASLPEFVNMVERYILGGDFMPTDKLYPFVPKDIITSQDTSSVSNYNYTADEKPVGVVGGATASAGVSTNVLKQNIINKYPAFKNVYGREGENLSIKADPNFTQGYGIEYFSPEQDTIRYDKGNVPHPDKGKYGVLYNPNEIEGGGLYEAVLGDMFHGMPNDPKFEELKDKFAKAAEKAGLKDNDRGWYERKKKAGEKLDSFEEYWSAEVDGRIRQLFQPNDKEHDIFMSEMSGEMKSIGEEIKKYMLKNQ